MVPNEATIDKCVCCDSPRPGSAATAPKASASTSIVFQPGGGFKFGNLNQSESISGGSGFKLGVQVPTEKKEQSGFKFGNFTASQSASSSGFKFGSTTTSSAAASTPLTSFKFGSANQSTTLTDKKQDQESTKGFNGG